MSTTEACRAAVEQLTGQQLAMVRYVGLSYDPGTEVRWDFGSWHHPEVGVELTTVAERRIPFIKWGHLLRFDPAEIDTWIDTYRHHPSRPRI